MTPINNSTVKSDMLTLLSTVGEILRALYFYGADYLMFVHEKNERLMHKEQLVALLEQGREKATLEDLSSITLTEPLSARMKIEDISPELPMLLFKDDALSLTLFSDYREGKLRDSMAELPDWWSVPLPLIHIKDNRISLNDRGRALIPGGVASLTGKIERIRGERILTVRWKKQEKTFALESLSEDIYLLEDISGDFEMAEDLIWWAAVGRAFVRRMEENGLSVKRLLPDETAPSGSAEVIPCSWDGELVGKLAFAIPGETPPLVPQEQSEVSADEAGMKSAKLRTEEASLEQDGKKSADSPAEEAPVSQAKQSSAGRKRAPARTKAEKPSDGSSLDVAG